MSSVKKFETYMLRNIIKDDIATPIQLRSELYKQFGEDLISSKLNFGIGYINGSSKVTIHSSADIDVWKMACSSNVVLWCEKAKKRVNVSSDNDSDEELERPKSKRKKNKLSALEEKQNRVETLVDKLRKKHCENFTTLQLRLWAEVLDGGTWK